MTEAALGANRTADAVRQLSAAHLSDELDSFEDRAVYFDVDATLDRATDIAQTADAMGEVELWQRARLVQADVWERKGRTAQAARTMWEVNGWAVEHGCRRLLARSHLLLARIHHNLGDLSACLEHSLSAMEALDDMAPRRTRALYLIRLGDAYGWIGSFDAARERYLQAEQLAVAVGDVDRQLQVLNNLAQTEYDADEPERARTALERLHAVATGAGRNITPSWLDTSARVHIALGRYAESEAAARLAIETYQAQSYEEVDALAEYLLTLAVAQRCQGAVDRAQDSLDRSLALCDVRDLAEIRVRVLQEQAEVYAAAGDFRRAFEAHKTFYREDEELRSRQREVQALTQQAMFETGEARREAARFREAAYRDALTGLHNRRFVDDHLSALLARNGQTGVPVTVALLDLDHFKRVNDTLSHDAGDRVLITVAKLLAAAVAEISSDGFAARLGGEEFLIVLPGIPQTEAFLKLETLRNAIRDHDWEPITGDLPVTVSIGFTSSDAVTDSTRATLLADADRNLYIAKRSGRDRTVTDSHRHGRRHVDMPGQQVRT